MYSENTHVIVTAAYNEERYIEGIVRSVVAQSRPPEEWFLELARRSAPRPPLTGALARLTGYRLDHLSGCERLLPRHAVSFLRSEQRQRVRAFFNVRRDDSKVAQ